MSPVASPWILLNIIILSYLNFIGVKSLNDAQFHEIYKFGREEEEVKPCGWFLYQRHSALLLDKVQSIQSATRNQLVNSPVYRTVSSIKEDEMISKLESWKMPII